MSVHQLVPWRRLRLLTCLVTVAAAGSVAVGQQTAGSDGVIYRGVFTAARFDISPPLTSIPEVPLSATKRATDDIDVDYTIGVEDRDEAVQPDVDFGGEIPATSVSFDGFTGNGPVPPDPVGDVGPNHYVAMANSRYAVYNKAGGLIFGPVNINTLWAGFGGACQVQNAGDPVVIHDQLANRWLLMQFTASPEPVTGLFYLCVALSTTPDPAGAFFRWAISTGTNFPDYPKVGMWPSPNAYVFTTREFAGAPFAGVGVYGLNRAQAIGGVAAAQVISFLATPGATPERVGDGLLPADFDGTRLPPAGSQAYLVGSQDNGLGAPIDALNLWKFNPNFALPAASALVLTNTLPVAAFDSVLNLCVVGATITRDCIPQPATAQRVDHQGYRRRVLHRLAYRNHGTHEAMVTNQSVEAVADMSGIRWYELRNPTVAPVIFQQGTYAPGIADGTHRWMGSIAQDQNGNMGLGYSASSAAVRPSVRYTGRLATDALGTMPQGEGSIMAGIGSQLVGSARWGDYTSMNVDPVDDCTLWYINEYYPADSTFAWRLRIGSFRYPQCAPAATITSLWPVGTVYYGQTARLWSLVRNDGTTAMPAGSRVWFLTNAVASGALTWVGSTSVAGLAAGGSAWYFYDHVIPAGTPQGARAYYAQVWFNSTYPQSSLTGPQAFTVGFPAVVDQLWPVPGAYPGATVQFWARVRNLSNLPLGNAARVYFWSSITSADVGSTSIVGLAGGASNWYLLNWPIPATAAPDFIRNYWAQARDSMGVSAWRGPQNFRMGFNYPFTTSIAGWAPVAGVWSLSGGNWLFTAGLANTISSVSHPEGTRYLDYQVRTWRYGCDGCANRIMIRGTPAPLGGGSTWNANFMFQYARDGQFSVFKTVAGVTSAIQNWTASPAIVQGSAWNLLRVVSHGDFFQFYINGILVWQGYDASLPVAGQVGIGEFNDSSAGNSLYVDYALGIPIGLGTDSAETADMPTDTVSEEQLRLNADANARPRGTADRAPKR